MWPSSQRACRRHESMGPPASPASHARCYCFSFAGINLWCRVTRSLASRETCIRVSLASIPRVPKGQTMHNTRIQMCAHTIMYKEPSTQRELIDPTLHPTMHHLLNAAPSSASSGWHIQQLLACFHAPSLCSLLEEQGRSTLERHCQGLQLVCHPCSSRQRNRHPESESAIQRSATQSGRQGRNDGAQSACGDPWHNLVMLGCRTKNLWPLSRKVPGSMQMLGDHAAASLRVNLGPAQKLVVNSACTLHWNARTSERW